MSDLAYYLYRLAGTVVPMVPTRLGYALAHWTGRIVASAMPSQRAVVRSNLRHVVGPQVPEAEVDQLARRTYTYMVKNYFDMFRVPRLSVQQVDSLVSLTGWEHVATALAAGRGAIIGAIHYGNVDLAMQKVAPLAQRLTGPAEHLKPERLYQYLVGLRSSKGVHLIPADGILTELFRALKRNELVGLALDRDTTDSGRVASLFGAPARLPDGAVQLALRTGAPVVFAHCRRAPDNRLHACIEPPIWVERTGDTEHDIEVGMRRVLSDVERCLREDPAQWVIFRPIWND
jgi:lauroyl/myristoyl acyltransferase